jgi:transposase
MTAALLPEALWDLVEPLLPIPSRCPRGGRPRISDRACLTGIVFVLRSGLPWQMLPQELGCGSGMTCWRRLRDWQQAGVWDLIHYAVLDWLARDDQIDWSRAVVDSCCIRAAYGGDQTGPNPTDRAKRGSKRHLICDGRGVPLAVRLTGANRNDSQEALALVDAIPPLHGERGRPRQRPDCVLGDRGYHSARAPTSSHRALAGDASHRAREWLGSMAVGRGAHICLAQSVSPLACAVRKAGRHPRGVPLARVRADLLAITAADVEQGLSGCPLARRPVASFNRHRLGDPVA